MYIEPGHMGLPCVMTEPHMEIALLFLHKTVASEQAGLSGPPPSTYI